MLESLVLLANKERHCQSDIMRLQYLDGFKAKAEAGESIHKREPCTTEKGANSQKNVIGSLVSTSRMFDGNGVEYEKKKKKKKKEFVILKLTDVVTSLSFLFPQIFIHKTCEQRTRFA
jgi:hypothetical protein